MRWSNGPFPSAHQIAIAIVAAARLHGEDPVKVAFGRGGVARARVFSYAALVAAFPDARKTGLAKAVGYSDIYPASAALNAGRKAKWWDEVAIARIAARAKQSPAKASEVDHGDNGGSGSGVGSPVAGEARWVDAGRTVSATSEQPTRQLGETAQNSGSGQGAVAVRGTPVGRSLATRDPGKVVASPFIAEANHFAPDERRLISRMWRGGADAVAIGATLGADADTIRAFAKANPNLCPEQM